LRGPEAKTLIFMVAGEEEWWLYAPEERPLEIPELPFKTPGVWAEDNPRSDPKCAPLVVELKLVSPPSARNSTSFLARHRSEFKSTLTDC
jgi:hypothetical protein